MVEIGPNQETKTPKEFSYDRDLFVKLFQQNPPFTNLGYSIKQRDEAMRAIRQLENTQGNVSQDYAEFVSDDNFYFSTIHRLETPTGRRLTAYRNIDEMILQANDNLTNEEFLLKKINHKPDVHFFDNLLNEVMAVVEVLPSDFDYENINSLVPALHEVKTERQKLNTMRRSNVLNQIRSRFTDDKNTFVYKAAWLDEQTKLDLVVVSESKLSRKLKAHMPEGSNITVWRRLPQIELDGKSWTPFGRKLNVNSEQAMGAFERESSKIVSGKFAMNPDYQ